MHVPQTEIILRHGSAELARITVPPGEYVIGRSADAEIKAETPLISRRHARLIIAHDELMIEDLGSSNGTFVAEEPVVQPTRVLPDQPLRLGDVQVEIHRLVVMGDPEQPPAPIPGAMLEPAATELLNERGYVIGQQVARGGMGAILQAQQNAMKRNVAMKVMLETADENDVVRFIEEAQITGQLEHPNIVPVHELGVDEQGQLFYTMKFVRGITLKKVIELLARGVPETAKKFHLSSLLTTFQKSCDAIAFAHSKGVIHRDLKPENLMLGDFGEVLVMDWGLAKVMGRLEASPSAPHSTVVSSRASHGDTSRTLSGTVMGTPAYMAPEQARGEVDTLDERADVYSLGAILFEILHLRPPFTGNDPWEIVAKVKEGALDWTPPKKPVPESLIAICRKALALDPAARYQRVENLQRDLDAYQHGFTTSAEKKSAWKEFKLLVHRNKAATIGIAAVLIVGATFGTRAVVEGRRAERALGDLKRNAPALLQLAETEETFQRFETALEKADGALSIDPSLTPAYPQRARILLGLERWTEAAAAFRMAARKDPANSGAASLAAAADQIAAMPDDTTRYTSPALAKIVDYLERAGGSGERLHFATRALVGAEKRQKLVQERLDKWRGGRVRVDLIGPLKVLTVKLSGATLTTLEPLRGLPIEDLSFNDRSITSLDPLRGMPLKELDCPGVGIEDLSPLQGVPLHRLNIQNTKVADLSPLKGMPLDDVDFTNIPAQDAAPLKGMPLKHLTWTGCVATDFSVLRGAPLEALALNGAQITDLSFLRGAPLRRFEMSGNRSLSDLRPLEGAPIEVLNLDHCPAIKDYRPLLTLTKLERLKAANARQTELEVLRKHPSLQFIASDNRGYLPVTDFWSKGGASVPGTLANRRRTPRTLDLAESADVKSLEFIRGLPLELLDLRRTGVTDLKPLAGMKSLKALRVAGIPVDDFSPIKGLPLTELRIGSSKFSDLSLLDGMPLVLLTIDKSKVTDVAPLAQMKTLRQLVIPRGATNIDALRALPNLQYLSYSFSIDLDRPDKLVAEFWAEYDGERPRK